MKTQQRENQMQTKIEYDSISREEIERHYAQAKIMRSQAVAQSFKSAARFVHNLFLKLVAPVPKLATK